jgi:hypothetical protein
MKVSATLLCFLAPAWGLSSRLLLSTSSNRYSNRYPRVNLKAVSGADIEQDTPKQPTTKSIKPPGAVPGADIEQDLVSSSSLPSSFKSDRFFYRGKVNEVDYCIAPADVSLSRAYGQISTKDNNNKDVQQNPMLSLTRALNNASNRAVRRILLVRCWPSAESLNLSLRLAATAEKQAFEEREKAGTASTATCPVPRPILNLLMRRDLGGDGSADQAASSRPRSRTDEEYVADQIKSFREKYGELEGYDYAEAYLESVLSLATSGQESPKVAEVGFFFRRRASRCRKRHLYDCS